MKTPSFIPSTAQLAIASLTGLVILTLSLRPVPPDRPNDLVASKAAYAQIPLAFEVNAGQTDA